MRVTKQSPAVKPQTSIRVVENWYEEFRNQQQD